MNVLVVYLGKDSLNNFRHSVTSGVWGFRPKKQPEKPFARGDILLFASGFTGKKIRWPVEKWLPNNVTMVATAVITSSLSTENTLQWPDEQAEGQVLYPKRFTFGDLIQKDGAFALHDVKTLPREVSLAIRKASIGGKGQVVSIESLPSWMRGDTSPPVPTPQPFLENANPVTTLEEASVTDTLLEIENYIASRGFTFPSHLVKALYSGLRSKPFAILAGNSGTGKSRLVRLFGEACGATVGNGQFTMIPVRPDWNDSSELLGFFDLGGHFIPDQLIAALLLAHRNPTKPYFVCLDEMNLARVEHYFSDFLSIVESRRTEGSTIATDPILKEAQLQNMKVDGLSSPVVEALNHLKSRGQPLGLPENLYVVGTVNMDETTQPFSRKVLDRANTIEFNDIDLLQGLDEEVAAAEVPPLDLGQTFFRPEFTTLNDLLPNHRDTAKRIAEMISALNHDLGRAGFEVGYRVRDEATSFAVYASDAGLSDEEIDEAIVLQKILPRVQGSSPRVEKLLLSLLKRLKGDSDVPDENDPELDQRLASLRVDADASAIVRKITGMLILFREENFTSFWLA